MRILVIGGGGREHAICRALRRSPLVTALYCAPGNGGIAELATCLPLAATDIAGLADAARHERFDLTVVGPEAPLAAGIVDHFTAEKLPIFGPTRASAQLEASKVATKTFLQRHGIPTARAAVATTYDDAIAHARSQPLPLVLKQDGLAAGKGVVIATQWPDVEATLQQWFRSADTQAILIEECLVGEELSCIAIASGSDYVLLAPAQDHKRLGDGDTGPNTGGMGAYSPVGLATPTLLERVRRCVIEPTLHGLIAEGRPFTGFLYAGLMIVDGNPYALEFNVRLGDPETQAILPRLQTDLVPLLVAATEARLGTPTLQWDRRSSVCVVMAAAGYPSDVRTGDIIHGLDTPQSADVTVFHAGTERRGDTYRTGGGRVLGVTALGHDLAAARRSAYAAIQHITWNGMQYRRDIGAARANTLT
ncbi:MAG: phosphoribosylamine--glycine ligase [Deltaproteobacteria bacterium]|nr:phosphoribosylamine--glycine ligase [Deltaproteobacteria bacterium]